MRHLVVILFILFCIASMARAETGIASIFSSQGVACKGLHYGPMTAAHKSLPCGSRVTVHAPSTGRTVTVTIVDRGPYVRGRIIDLSEDAARELGIYQMGVAWVNIQ